jgi:rsbT co-antagonist protein RsbR
MSPHGKSRLSEILERHEAAILGKWVAAQKAAPTYRPDLIKES